MLFKRMFGSILAVMLAASLASCASLVGMMKQGKYADVLKTIEASKDCPTTQEDEAGDTALTYAITNIKVDIVKALVKKGTDLEYKTRKGVTPMSAAADTGDIEIVRVLFDAGAKPDAVGAKGKTPLSLAFGANDFELAKRMVDKGADVNAAETVKAAYAADMGRILGKEPDYGFKYVRFLFEKGLKNFDAGFDKSLQINDSARGVFNDAGVPLFSALEYWFYDKGVDKAAFLKEAIARGVSPTFTSASYKYTALHFAVVKKDAGTVKLLLDAWKDRGVNTVDFAGQTALCLAAHTSQKEIVSILLACGADAKIGNGKQSPIFWTWNFDIAKELIKAGVNVNSVGDGGYCGGFTPLVYAVAHARMDLARLYFENGANPSQLTSADCKFNNDVPMPSFTLYDVARTTKNKEMIAFVAGLKPEFTEAHERLAKLDAILADPVFAKLRDFGASAVKKDYKGALAAVNAALDALKDGDPDHDAVAAAVKEFDDKTRGTDTITLLQSGKYEAYDLPGLIKKAQAEKAVMDLGRALARNAKCAEVLAAGAKAAAGVSPTRTDYRSPFAAAAAPDPKKAAQFAQLTKYNVSMTSSNVEQFMKLASENETLPFVDAEGNDLLMFLLRNRPGSYDSGSFQAYFKLITVVKGKVDLSAKNKAGKGFIDIVTEYERKADELMANRPKSSAGSGKKSQSELIAELSASAALTNRMKYEFDMNRGIKEALLK